MRGWRPSALPTCVPLFGFVKGRRDQPHALPSTPPRPPPPPPLNSTTQQPEPQHPRIRELSSAISSAGGVASPGHPSPVVSPAVRWPMCPGVFVAPLRTCTCRKSPATPRTPHPAPGTLMHTPHARVCMCARPCIQVSPRHIGRVVSQPDWLAVGYRRVATALGLQPRPPRVCTRHHLPCTLEAAKRFLRGYVRECRGALCGLRRGHRPRALGLPTQQGEWAGSPSLSLLAHIHSHTNPEPRAPPTHTQAASPCRPLCA